MSERHGILDSITDALVPVHRDGHKFVGIGLILTLLGFLLWSPFGWVMALITTWIVYFFRDPDRITPLRDGLVIAPADGRVSSIEVVKPSGELGFTDGLERMRVSIFLSVFDVHINRSPVAGRIVRSLYVPGAFLNASMDKASDENERRVIVVETTAGTQIGCVQIAGLIARRIVTFAQESPSVKRGAVKVLLLVRRAMSGGSGGVL